MASLGILSPCLVWLLCFITFLGSLPEATCSERENDQQALLCFKSQLSAPADVFATWSNASLEFCSWHGITCSQRSPRRVIVLDLASEGITGTISPCIANLTSLTRLQLSNNSFHGSIPSELGLLSELSSLNLSMNSLEGSIPQSFAELRGMKELDISRNNLSGKIPEFFTSLNSLHYLNLSFNNFDGAVPRGGIFANASAVSIEGNDQLCSSVLTGGIPLCSALGDDRKSKHTYLVLVAKIVIPVVIIILFCLAAFLGRKRMQAQAHLQQLNKNITYDDIVKATDMFSSTNLIGSGSFGKVYKGSMGLHKDQVAIKIFNLNIYGAHRSFLAECEALRNARHRNIVKIITLCSSVDPTGADFKAIVFPYMLNGNLDMWLNQRAHEHSQRNILTLSQRINVALDLANAMDYLHNQCASPLIHCDLKPSNILLDHGMVAYVSDFGLARFQCTKSSTHKDSSATLPGLKGSIGYIPPEYGMSQDISTKGDVYSFGVLLLEMMTGCRPTDEKFSNGTNLHEFVDRAFPKNINEVVDPTMLQDDISANNVLQNCIIPLVKIGLSCSMTSPKERPGMDKVSTEILAIKNMFSSIHEHDQSK
ncbi:putative receptor-like protein kinase At3g47110 isoform X2 [Panicum hallii]|uniref:putative receptor-like protein kinase At3g47110 isoform X2 n=1 Tax=Panicum hallii TaxID=206008 RepID=UPI000DF4EB08|nr:putative receptor-like protein kinase At3g47110 isoform X2 [Panicum hallii]